MNALRFALVLMLAQAGSFPAPVTISGVVIERGSDRRIPGAAIELYSVSSYSQIPSNFQKATSMEDGTFTFRPVAPGNYSVAAYHPGNDRVQFSGFVNASTAVRFEMTQPGAISGRVQDMDGKPIRNAHVIPMKPRYSGSVLYLDYAPVFGVTNDLGEYRIPDLPPGLYFVMMQSYFFPETTDIRDASLVEVRSGDERRDINIRRLQTSTVGIRGAVIDASGQPASSGRVVLTSRNGPFGQFAETSTIQNGQFNFDKGVAPGPYYLVADLGANPNSGPPFSETAGNASIVPIDLVASNDWSASLVVTSGFDIPVRITLEGTPGPVPPLSASGRIVVSLGMESDTRFDQSTSLARYLFFASQNLSPANTAQSTISSYVIRNVQPGDYRFTISGQIRPDTGGAGPVPGIIPLVRQEAPPPSPAASLQGMYVKSIHLQNLDLSSGLVKIQGTGSTLEIVLSANPASLRGQVLDENERGISGITVVAIPDKSLRNRDDLYRFATTTSTGQYQLELAPGNYKVIAFQGLTSEIWRAPAFMRLYEDRGKSIHVDEGSHANLDLAAISVPH
jgi:hypothetical protein